MAKGYSAQLVGVLDGSAVPAIKADGRVYNARPRIFRAVFDLASANVAKNNGDSNVICVLPEGYAFRSLSFTSSVSLGTSTISVGIAGATAKYKAAAVFTAVDTPTGYALASAKAQAPLAAKEEVIFTIGAANLPGAGTLVIELEAIGR